MASLLERQDILCHISHQFDEDLSDIHRDILAIGDMVAEQMALGMKALSKADAELSEPAVADEYRIDASQVTVDEACVRVLARRQPTARDLRLVRALSKVMTDLDLMGSEAKRFAVRATDLAGQSPRKNQLTDLARLASCVDAMLHDALGVLAEMDLAKAIAVLQTDQGIRGQYENILRQQITYMMEDPRSAPLCVSILCSAHSLECVGQGADNLCRYVIYYASAKDVRHIPKVEMQKILNSGTELSK